MSESLGRACKGKLATFAVGVVGVAVTGVLDYVTGYEVRLFPLYFLPVAYIAWRMSQVSVLALSALSAAAWACSDWMGGRVYSNPLTYPINIFSQFLAFAIVGILVAKLRATLKEEQELGRRDALTSLSNGRAFYEQGEILLAIARRSGRPLTVAYLDLDNFKQVNDECGHEEGDRALKEVAETLRSNLRSSDLIARLGGDEFGVLLVDTGPEVARASLERVQSRIVSAMRQNQWPVTVSAGAISYMHAPTTLEEAINKADSAMYRAKGAGKSRIDIEVIDSTSLPGN
jgi:diguanylate cyclase (GGDEF)-like protein